MSDFRSSFQSPPLTYGPAPFYWWAGEPLERERLADQLDRLCDKGVRRVIVSYPHGPDGANLSGKPELFSEEWWELFRWFLHACRQRGMKAGFQDYTLIEPILQEIGRDTPGMQGGRLHGVACRAGKGETIRLDVPADRVPVGAWAYPADNGFADAGRAVSLSDSLIDGSLCWQAPSGDWLVALVLVEPSGFDPLHSDAGNLAIGRLYEPFERECPDELGKTLDTFFQDELDFRIRMPFWSDFLPGYFLERMGYDPEPLLPALWFDLGPVSEKFRLDYADAIVSRLESVYFEPVFRWHESRGILFGHDNCGRGDIAQGRAHYGDYFRVMRWFSAPGCDDPKLHLPRAFKGLKINSSIAHLYGRPRVWIEAFHSSGWGTTPAEVLAALNEDFAYGANLVNLHGLYYSTRGGWWEWAPPDFHFRQPYWRHNQPFNDYITRLCWILSQGVKQCDVAMLYPIDALNAEPTSTDCPAEVPHAGYEPIGGETDAANLPGLAAFSLGKHLFENACDFDFVDCESLVAGATDNGVLEAGPGRYRVLILPEMGAARFAALQKALEFARGGGLVIAYGRMPSATERAGREDPQVDALLMELFGASREGGDVCKLHPNGGIACFIARGFEKILEIIRNTIEGDVVSSHPLQVLHRRTYTRDIYYINNPSAEKITAELAFRADGDATGWNAWTGACLPLPAGSRQTLLLEPHEAKLIVFERSPDSREESAADSPAPAIIETETLGDIWDFTIEPTMDNRFGDFRLPASAELLGPEARRFQYADEFDDREPAEEDWRNTTYSFGARFEFAGPFPASTDFAALEERMSGGDPGIHWQPYEFSLQHGIERDPLLTDWLTGPHGLKGEVPCEFLDFHSDHPGDTWYLRTSIEVDREGTHRLVAGSRCAFEVRLNGEVAAKQPTPLPPGIYPRWDIPHYECEPIESAVQLRKGRNDLLVKLVQSTSQRSRAYVVVDPPSNQLPDPILRWFTSPTTPRPHLLAPESRRAIRFRFPTPPGTREIRFVARGASKVWIQGTLVNAHLKEVTEDGLHHYRVVLEVPVPECAEAILRVEAPRSSHAGDALPEPVRFACGTGRIPLGDWCHHGLATYSGAATYARAFEVRDADARLAIDLGQLNATAEIRINGALAATLVAPPWRADITGLVKTGTNHLTITVANTLANHYSVGIPTPYAFENQTPSGLFGPVKLLRF